MIRRALACTAVAALVAGCGRDALMRCEDPEAYYDAPERPPIHVPDDLSVPDQSEALSIPPPERVRGAQPNAANRPCLESPPRFYDGIEEAEDGAADEAAVPPS